MDLSEPAKETIDTEDLLSTDDSKSNVLDDSQDIEVEPDTSELKDEGSVIFRFSFIFICTAQATSRLTLTTVSTRDVVQAVQQCRLKGTVHLPSGTSDMNNSSWKRRGNMF